MYKNLNNDLNRSKLRKTKSSKQEGLHSPHYALYLKDNIDVLKNIASEFIKCIYIDPPFFTQKKQIIDSRRSDINTPFYFDNWRSMKEYLNWIKIRIFEMKRVLRKDGIIAIHCDWHASHYIKIILDEIFGYNNFRNEIIWQRSFTIGRSSTKNFKKIDVIHDSIFIYSKSSKTTLNKVYREHMIPFQENNPPAGYYFDDKRNSFFKTSPLGNYSDLSIKKFSKEGRVYRTRNGKKRLKYFVNTLKHNNQKFIFEQRELGTIWNDIHSMMHSGTGDKIKYPTQKPINLIKRIFSHDSKQR